MADSRRRQQAALPQQVTQSRPAQFLAIREAIDNQSPMNTVPSTPPSPRSMRNASRPPPDGDEQRLSIISEDGDAHVHGSRPVATPAPAASTHRPFARRWRDAPPRASSDLEPPEYSIIEDGKPRRDRLAELRNKPGVARRGGFWRLLAFIALAIVIVAVALGVGLGVGLKNHNNSDNASSGSGSSSSGDNSSANSTFPAGHWAINPTLETVLDSCTANPNTFRCNSQNGVGSQTSFDWIITESNNKYLISTSINPFATAFSNIPLTLVDAGAATEHYTFSIPINVSVTPSAAITTDNMQALCWYNGTTLSANLYTKMLDSAQNSTSNTQATWQPWPFAAEINQTIAGGDNVPACYEYANGQQGAQVTNGLSPQSSNTECGCFYRNYNLL